MSPFTYSARRASDPASDEAAYRYEPKYIEYIGDSNRNVTEAAKAEKAKGWAAAAAATSATTTTDPVWNDGGDGMAAISLSSASSWQASTAAYNLPPRLRPLSIYASSSKEGPPSKQEEEAGATALAPSHQGSHGPPFAATTELARDSTDAVQTRIRIRGGRGSPRKGGKKLRICPFFIKLTRHKTRKGRYKVPSNNKSPFIFHWFPPFAQVTLTYLPLPPGNNDSTLLMPQAPGDILEFGCLPNGTAGTFFIPSSLGCCPSQSRS